MKKLMGMGACLTLALLVGGCSEQAKSKMKAAAGQAKGQVEQAGKAAQEVGSTATEAATKSLDEAKTKIGAAAKKSSEALGETFTKATEEASMTLKDVKGGSDVLQKVTAVFPSLQQTLAGISDSESAQKALPKLDELEGMVSKASTQFEQLPESARKTVAGLVQKGAAGIQPLVDQVLDLPAVEPIRPKVEAIMKKLKGLS